MDWQFAIEKNREALAAVIAEARAGGISKLQCFSSLPGEPFYARHGFRKVEDVTIMMSEDAAFPAVLMEREV